MPNINYDDPTIAFWIILCLTAPIALAFLSRIMWGFAAALEAMIPQTQETAEAPIEVRVAVERSMVTQTPAIKPERIAVPDTPAAPTTDPQIMSDTVDALKTLGFSATDSKQIAANLGASKVYPDAESLLADCLKQMK